MCLFKKAKIDYETVELPFILDDFSIQEGDDKRCSIDIEAYGIIDGKMRYFYSGYVLKNQEMYENGDFDNMLGLLRTSENKHVNIKMKYKNGTLKDFSLSLESLAKAYDDERFLQLELIGWGINDKSCKDNQVNLREG